MLESRTAKSIKNVKVAVSFSLISIVLNFFSRKFFLDYLGTEILGLNTTAYNLLAFLNLAELGIGLAISYSLYNPLSLHDYKKINEIVSVQGYLYKIIGCIVIAFSIVIMFFFPIIFKKADVPTYYTYLAFIVFLIGSLLSYFWNYRQILLSADQKEYKITYVRQSLNFIKILIQVLVIVLVKNGYLYWLATEFIFSILITISLNLIINREYPWLKTKLSEGKTLQKKYPEIILKTKQLFFHKIGGFILTQTSPIIIYGYTSLSLVALYSNYLIIINGVSMLLASIFNSIAAGVGNLIVQGDKKNIVNVFWELFTFRFLIVSTACYSVFWLSQPFVEIWIGKQYILDEKFLLIMTLIMYINTMRLVVDVFIQGYGLFSDIWATITESTLNLLFSIICGYLWGLNGVLTGVLISLILIIFIWKPYFLFRKGFNLAFNEYAYGYIKHLAVLIPVILMINYLIQNIPHNLSPIVVGIYRLLYILLFFTLLTFLLYLTNNSMKRFSLRLKVEVKNIFFK